ncbi:MAG: leucine--tRNA ligase [Sphingobacteriales bacterium]|jgi:leucyl-tRNA synthetase|nr:leucine--tRNA ligase [Sphingobacteriales bacterium]MBK6889100.1 leucine--tRNA ligase [Sphingobacteriales bacterium]MBK7528397.1 leucine--tRNA ligase [Sphingobacteriales bacterium]MBP9140668.1 leucine--tRNA ligase [Chitinophagales bacterium]MDA0198910.1 leucine--tRNA ligase [Bacteroidota bacterium]
MKDYNPQTIEVHWRQYWEKNDIYQTKNESNKPKYYILDMFPYPSGAGLHVGHPLGYIASDIVARFKRMKGFNVLHPMGFDAFGLPAEQYALESGQHPQITQQKSIAIFKSQLQNLGLSYDWDRKLSTCDSNFYKWTQWIFIQLFNSWYNSSTNKAESIDNLIEIFNTTGSTAVQALHDKHEAFTASDWQNYNKTQQQNILMQYRLAYRSFTTVNWCEALGCVLANDEVINGVSERGGHPVTKKLMQQWNIRIEAYAQRLLDDLEDLDWPVSMKTIQRNWIGRSEGASIWFELAEPLQGGFEIFTTRPDTIFGLSFMVLAPEHPLVATITTPEQTSKIKAYQAWTDNRNDIERQSEKQVSGVFTGAYALHPFTGQKIPIWISEYVLMGYGTGAIMAVPSDDDRDEAFALQFNLPILPIIDKTAYPYATKSDKVGTLINSGFITGLEVKDAIEAVIHRLETQKIGSRMVNFKLRDWGFGRQRYWGEPIPIVYDEEGNPQPLPYEDLPLLLPNTNDFEPSGTGESPLAKLTNWVNTPQGRRETDTMPGSAGSSWYFLRYMDVHNQHALASPEAINYWQNVDFYVGGAEHGTGHLIYARMWHKFLYDLGIVPTIEPFQKLVNQGMIQGVSALVFRINNTNQYVSSGLASQYQTTALRVPVQFVNDNNELNIAQLRAWRSEFAEAEFILENNEYICGTANEKMSKRYHNVVNPDDMVRLYGADCFRMYEMFLGPIEDSKPWNTKNIVGVSRFLRKLWSLFNCDEAGNPQLSTAPPSTESLKAIHRCLERVHNDIERFNLNTCVSHYMICVNKLADEKCSHPEVLRLLTLSIAPFAPHLAEELWSKLGHEQAGNSVHLQNFPNFDPAFTRDDTKQFPIQINGKIRATLELPLGLDEAAMKTAVTTHPDLQSLLSNVSIKKFIYVPGRIVNLLVG